MGTVIDFDRATWTCYDALIDIFFSDWNALEENNDFRAEIKRYIGAYSTNKTCKVLHLNEDQLTKINYLVDITQRLTKQPLSELYETPLVWIKFAFIALGKGATISEKFIRRYARWRLTRAITHGAETVIHKVDNSSNKTNNNNLVIAGHRFSGFTLDLFLFSKKIPLNLGNRTHWKLSGTNTSKTKRQKLASVMEVSGTNLTNNVAYCLETAVATGRIPDLRNEKIQGRFLCDISRKELTKRLMRNFKSHLPYSESAILRTLSTFVACPGYRIKN